MVGTTLYFIKTKNTGSGKVEIHSATAASGYQSGIHTTTWLSPSDANNGWFQMVGTTLYFIKTKNRFRQGRDPLGYGGIGVPERHPHDHLALAERREQRLVPGRRQVVGVNKAG